MEVWKPIQGFEGYEVSTQGRVRSVDRMIKGRNGCVYPHPGQLLRPITDKYGSDRVGLYGDKRYVAPIHMLVARTFLANPTNAKLVKHINGNKHDNRLENLEWVVKQPRKPMKIKREETGHTNIRKLSWNTQNGMSVRYQAEIRKYGRTATFKDLNKAIEWRDRIINQYEGEIL